MREKDFDRARRFHHYVEDYNNSDFIMTFDALKRERFYFLLITYWTYCALNLFLSTTINREKCGAIRIHRGAFYNSRNRRAILREIKMI